MVKSLIAFSIVTGMCLFTGWFGGMDFGARTMGNGLIMLCALFFGIIAAVAAAEDYHG